MGIPETTGGEKKEGVNNSTYTQYSMVGKGTTAGCDGEESTKDSFLNGLSTREWHGTREARRR